MCDSCSDYSSSSCGSCGPCDPCRKCHKFDVKAVDCCGRKYLKRITICDGQPGPPGDFYLSAITLTQTAMLSGKNASTSFAPSLWTVLACKNASYSSTGILTVNPAFYLVTVSAVVNDSWNATTSLGFYQIIDGGSNNALQLATATPLGSPATGTATPPPSVILSASGGLQLSSNTINLQYFSVFYNNSTAGAIMGPFAFTISIKQVI